MNIGVKELIHVAKELQQRVTKLETTITCIKKVIKKQAGLPENGNISICEQESGKFDFKKDFKN